MLIKKLFFNHKYPHPILVEIFRFLFLVVSKILWRIEFHNLENIPQDLKRGLLIIPNHQTYFDPFWICLPIKYRLRFMTWYKALNWFVVGRFIGYLGAFPVRASGSSRGALKEALRFLKDGNALLIFPEGEREFSDGKLLNFKTGAARIATRANIPILPVTIRGGHKIWARNHRIPKCKKVEIIYHPILKPSDYKNRLKREKQVEKLNSKLKEIILSEM